MGELPNHQFKNLLPHFLWFILLVYNSQIHKSSNNSNLDHNLQITHFASFLISKGSNFKYLNAEESDQKGSPQEMDKIYPQTLLI